MPYEDGDFLFPSDLAHDLREYFEDNFPLRSFPLTQMFFISDDGLFGTTAVMKITKEQRAAGFLWLNQEENKERWICPMCVQIVPSNDVEWHLGKYSVSLYKKIL